MVYRKTPCDVCENGNIAISLDISFQNNTVWQNYEERCTLCDNLLYGYFKKLRGYEDN